jgi:2-polyprenyl-3-methyl-5-hydroxy-6-metoxy-1,4-benzoquinol methylase
MDERILSISKRVEIMDNTRDDIYKAFIKVRSSFPFDEYMTNSKFNKYYQLILKIMEVYPQGSTILSIGAGPCDFEAILSQLNYIVTAVDDLSDQWHLIGKNRERIQEFARKYNINLITQFGEKCLLKEKSFDVVLMIDIIEHLVKSPIDLLNYGISLLKTNGMLLIETPNAVNLFNRIKVISGKSNQVRAEFIFWNIGTFRSHFREYTISELEKILSMMKLVNIDEKLFNIQTDSIYCSTKGISRKVAIFLYKFISNLYPKFRDTIIISGKKPKGWSPLYISIDKFKELYYQIDKYNLDNLSNDILINQILSKPEL